MLILLLISPRRVARQPHRHGKYAKLLDVPQKRQRKYAGGEATARVAWIEQSEIRDRLVNTAKPTPDFTPLNPGYEKKWEEWSKCARSRSATSPSPASSSGMGHGGGPRRCFPPMIPTLDGGISPSSIRRSSTRFRGAW